ncbi:putative glycosyl transferase CAP10 domain-containing protein [Helianthus annuus]|nr:putative glycosyl transferase CAP10 domain-containing protein [Helianthus annuus]
MSETYSETNLKPWEMTLKDIKEGNKRVNWKDRIPFAYWRGNPSVSPVRADLVKCNVNNTHNLDWDTRLFIQVIKAGESLNLFRCGRVEKNGYILGIFK